MTPRRVSWLWTVFLVCILSPSFGDTGIGGSCGSDDCEPPLTIGRLPFSDSANTCSFTNTVNEYTAMCPIGGVPYFGPDVVYKVQLTRGNRVGFRLTSPDTDFVLVLQAACGPGKDCINSSPDFIGAGEDIIEEMPLGEYPPGIYYLYVDAFREEDDEGGPCGFYELEVFGDNPVEPDLRLEEAAPSPTAAGENLVYTLAATNDGAFAATGVTVSAILPAGVELVEFLSSDCWETIPAGAVCRFEEFDRNQRELLQLGVHVEPLQRESFAIPVSIQGVEPDPLPANNRVVLTAPVTIEADVSVRMTASPSPVVAGEELVYRLEATNTGPLPATEVVVTDELPAGLLMTELPGFCMAAANGVVCRIGDLEPGESRVGVIRSTVDPAARGTLTNVATIRATEPDPVPNNNRAEVVIPLLARADLRVSLAAPKAVLAKEDLTYDLTVANEGPSTATEVQLTTSLQAGAELKDIPTGCEQQGQRRFRCELEELAPGDVVHGSFSGEQQGQRRFRCELEELAPDDVVRGCFSVATDSAFRGELVTLTTVTNRKLVGTPRETDPDPSNNRAVVRTEVVGMTTLSLAKVALPDSVKLIEGKTSVLFYELAVTNTGSEDAVDVIVRDEFDGPDDLPAGVGSPVSVGCENDPAGFPECMLGSLPVGASAEYVLAFEIDDAAPDSLTNTATAQSGGVGPGGMASTQVSVDDPVKDVNLKVMIEVDVMGAPANLGAMSLLGVLPAGKMLEYNIQVTVPEDSDVAEVIVDTRASRRLSFQTSRGRGFPRSKLREVQGQGFFSGSLVFQIQSKLPDPIVSDFTVSALNEAEEVIAQVVMECEDDVCSEVPPEFSPSDGGPSLVLPRFRIDRNMPESETTRFTVRNGDRLPVVARFDYYDDEGETLLRPPQVRALRPRAVESIDILRDVAFPTFPTPEKSGSVRITILDPSTGKPVSSPAVQGDFIHIEPGSQAASGSLLFDLEQPPALGCMKWNVGFFGDEPFNAGTDWTLLLPDNPGSEVEATLYDEAGVATQIGPVSTSLDSFEVNSSDLVNGSPGSLDLRFGLPGVVFATHRGAGLAVGAPGVCLESPNNGRELLVPFYEVVDEDGKTTRFSLRNTRSQGTMSTVQCFSAKKKNPEAGFKLDLPGHATRVVDVGTDLANACPEAGFIRIRGENTDDALAGEYVLFDSIEETAHGGALVNKDLDQVPADLCRRWDQRFVQPNGVSTEVLVYVEKEGRPGKAELGDGGASAPVLVGKQFDEEGVLSGVLKTRTENQDPPAIEICESCQSFPEMSSCVCRFSLKDVQGSGTIEWRFRNDKIGHIAYILESGEMSVLIPAVCRDLGPPDATP